MMRISSLLLITTAAALLACQPSPPPQGGGKGDSALMQDKAGQTVLARINGSAIYQSDIDRAAQAAGQDTVVPGSAGFETLLDEAIDQRLLALKAEALSLDKTPTGQERLDLARERILGNLTVEDHLAKTVNDESAKKLYTEQIKLRQSGDEVRARHILLADKAGADAAAKRIAAGEDFAAVASDLSIDPGSQRDGGDLGYFQKDAMVAPFSAAVFAMKKGEVSEPFETEFGWHIAKLEDRRKAAVPTFEAMKPEILNYLTLQEIGNLIKSVREDAQIEVLTPSIDRPSSEAILPQDIAGSGPPTEDLPPKDTP